MKFEPPLRRRPYTLLRSVTNCKIDLMLDYANARSGSTFAVSLRFRCYK
jgi:hypothetical protein